MNQKTDHPFKAGTRVLVSIESSYHGTEFHEDTVAKVYKNGNFVLTDKRHKGHQFRPGVERGWDGRRDTWKAWRTGGGVWSAGSVRVELPEAEARKLWEERRERARVQREFNDALNRLRRVPRTRATAETVDLLTKALKSLKPENAGRAP